MAKTITTRLPDEYVSDLNKVAKIENLDISSTLRRLLAKALKEWKKDYAVELYKKGEFSLGQLAEFAEISIWDAPILLKEKGVYLNLDLDELESELKTIKWKKKQ